MISKRRCMTAIIQADGHVYESLSSFGLGPFDKPGGRLMGDTTTLFVLEVYEIFMHMGNATFVEKLWPSVKKAIGWCINNANQPVESDGEPYGLPQKITTTYDHFGWEHQQVCSWSANMLLL